MFSWLRDAMSTPMLDEIERLGAAEHALNEQGIFPPAVPNRMQCAPNVNDMLNAFGDGVELGQYMTEGVDHLRGNASTTDQFIDAGWGSLFSVVSQLWTDTKNIQKCMDNQDEKYEEDTKKYVEQVKEIAQELPPPRPEPVTPQFVNVQGRWMGPGGVIQDHYDPSNCGGGLGAGGGGGDGNGIDHGSSSGGGDLMNIVIDCSGGHWESNGDGTSSCKMP